MDVRSRSGLDTSRYLNVFWSLITKNQIEYAFVVNDSTDTTLEILQKFALVHHSRSSYPAEYVESQFVFPGAYNIANLVVLRNILLNMFIKSDCSHLFSVDSDILVTPDSLNELIKLDLSVVSLLVRNDHHIGELGYYNISRLQGGNITLFVTSSRSSVTGRLYRSRLFNQTVCN